MLPVGRRTTPSHHGTCRMFRSQAAASDSCLHTRSGQGNRNGRYTAVLKACGKTSSIFAMLCAPLVLSAAPTKRIRRKQARKPSGVMPGGCHGSFSPKDSTERAGRPGSLSKKRGTPPQGKTDRTPCPSGFGHVEPPVCMGDSRIAPRGQARESLQPGAWTHGYPPGPGERCRG